MATPPRPEASVAVAAPVSSANPSGAGEGACAAARGGRAGSSRRRVVSMPSARSARRSARSTWGRSARASGAKSTVTWPPSPRRRSWRGSSAAAARFAFSAAAGERSAPVSTSTATSARVGSMASDPWPSATAGRRRASTSSQTPASASAVGASRKASAPLVHSRCATAAAPGAGRTTPGAVSGAATIACHPARSAAISEATLASSASADAERRMSPRSGSAPAMARSASASSAARRAGSRIVRATLSPGAPGVSTAARPRSARRWVTGGALRGSAQPVTWTSSGRPGGGSRAPRRKPVSPAPRSTIAPPVPFIGRPGRAR